MTIEIRVIRSLFYDGAWRTPGGCLFVTPLTAAELLTSGRVEIVDASDLEVIHDGLQDAAKTLQKLS